MTKQAKQAKQPIRKQGNNAITRFTRNSLKKKKRNPLRTTYASPVQFFSLPNSRTLFPLTPSKTTLLSGARAR